MAMTPRLRKIVLTIHITSSVGWLGAVVAYLSLAVAALTRQDAHTVRVAWGAMALIGWYIIVPLALASVLIGIINALGTPWGLFRHYWVLVKFSLTIFATLILLGHMPVVSDFADIAVKTNSVSLDGLMGELVHAGGGLLVLVVTTVLSVYKPRGITRYGRRMQTETCQAAPSFYSDTSAGTSRKWDWQKAPILIALILVLLFLIMHLINGGPGGH